MLGSVLITGGTGYLGRHLVRRLLDDKMSDRICVYNRGEHAQADMRAQFDDDDRLRFFIGCVRDQRRLQRAMQGVDVVIHAAALKRIETGFWNPVECVRTNIDGTIACIEAVQDAGVKKMLFVSSDKAVEAKSIYGLTKAVGEAAVLAANNTVSRSGPRYSLTRYGNIFNASGSVVPKWRAMIARGVRAVPVTDLNATRFFMTADQAVDLVLNTIETMSGGEVAIPDLPAYRVGDLVEAMGTLASVQGMPEFEKMHEKMSEDHSSEHARRMSVAELRQALGMIEEKAAA